MGNLDSKNPVLLIKLQLFILLFVLILHKQTTFQPNRYEDFQSSIAILNFVSEGKRMAIPDDCVFKATIEKCWRQVPNERPKFEDVISDLKEISKIN